MTENDTTSPGRSPIAARRGQPPPNRARRRHAAAARRILLTGLVAASTAGMAVTMAANASAAEASQATAVSFDPAPSPEATEPAAPVRTVIIVRRHLIPAASTAPAATTGAHTASTPRSPAPAAPARAQPAPAPAPATRSQGS